MTGGISVLPVTSLGLNHEAPTERISSGIAPLDAMLDGQGYYRGGSVLISGTPGAGKSSLSAHFIDAACARGERCMYFPFEESQRQIVRNMRSIGIDLGRWLERGLLRFHPARPQVAGLGVASGADAQADRRFRSRGGGDRSGDQSHRNRQLGWKPKRCSCAWWIF